MLFGGHPRTLLGLTSRGLPAAPPSVGDLCPPLSGCSGSPIFGVQTAQAVCLGSWAPAPASGSVQMTQTEPRVGQSPPFRDDSLPSPACSCSLSSVFKLIFMTSSNRLHVLGLQKSGEARTEFPYTLYCLHTAMRPPPCTRMVFPLSILH